MLKILGRINLETGKLIEGDPSILQQPKVLVKYEIPFTFISDDRYPRRIEVPIK